MDGWNTIVSFWETGLFSGAFAVRFREGTPPMEKFRHISAAKLLQDIFRQAFDFRPSIRVT